DPDQDVELSCPKGSQYLNPLNRINLAMQIADFKSDVAEVICQIFGGSFRQGRDQNAFPALCSFPTEFNGFIDLMLERAYGNLWIQQARWPNDLLDYQAGPRFLDIKCLGRTTCKHRHQNRLSLLLADARARVGDILLVSYNAILDFKRRRCRTDVKNL